MSLNLLTHPEGLQVCREALSEMTATQNDFLIPLRFTLLSISFQ
jgi:hypothetical protein